MTQRLQQLLDGLAVLIQYEKDNKNLRNYIQLMNVVLNPTSPYQECGHCAALMKRYHSDFQRALWSEILKEDPRFVPELPAFVTAKYNTDFYSRMLRVMSFSDLVANETNCRNQATKAKRQRNNLDADRYAQDLESIKAYRLTKYNYFEDFLPKLLVKLESEVATKFPDNTQEASEEKIVAVREAAPNERKGKIDKDELVILKNEGKSNKYCAEHFNVSTGAISQMLKKIDYVKN